MGYVLGLENPDLPALGFGVWRAVDDTTIEAVMRIAWMDAGVATQVVANMRATVDGNGLVSTWTMSMLDEQGNVIGTDRGRDPASRMIFEPFGASATPEA